MTSMKSKRIAIGVTLSSLVLAPGLFYVWPWCDGSPAGSDTRGRTGGELSNLWSDIRERASTGPSPAATRAAQLRAFGVLRSRPERMPWRMREHIRKTVGSPPGGLDLARAQHARTDEGGMWIVSGRYVTCVAQGSRGAVVCDSAAAFASRGLALGAVEAPGHPTALSRSFLVLGVAPDWARAAWLETKGVLRRITVQGNTYALRSNAPITLKRLERPLEPSRRDTFLVIPPAVAPHMPT